MNENLSDLCLFIYLFRNFHPAVKKKEKAVTKQNIQS